MSVIPPREVALHFSKIIELNDLSPQETCRMLFFLFGMQMRLLERLGMPLTEATFKTMVAEAITNAKREDISSE